MALMWAKLSESHLVAVDSLGLILAHIQAHWTGTWVDRPHRAALVFKGGLDDAIAWIEEEWH